MRKGYTFVFPPTSADREHWGVGICYKGYMEKYRNYHRQVSNNLIAMELNMHGNPIMLASAYIPHDDTKDDRIRQRAWEDLTNLINETPEANNTIILGDLNTNIHARKEEEEGHIGPHIWKRNGFPEEQRTQHPAKQNHQQGIHGQPSQGHRYESRKHILRIRNLTNLRAHTRGSIT